MSTCLLHALSLTLSAPTIKIFGNGGLESCNVLQLLFTCWNLLIQQFEWVEFKALWTSCTGTPMQKMIDQPFLTSWWEYVGKAIAWLIPKKLDELNKFAQAVVNTNSSISAKIRLHWHLPCLETKMLIMHISHS